MKPYQIALHDEKFDLERRRRSLSSFRASEVWQKVDPKEQARIVSQIGIMAEYAGILQERIDAFPKDKTR